jgi:hypothetical protein
MNVEIGAEAALFPEKEYINGIAVALWTLKRQSIYEITDNILKHMVNLQEDGPPRMVKDE